MRIIEAWGISSNQNKDALETVINRLQGSIVEEGPRVEADEIQTVHCSNP